MTPKTKEAHLSNQDLKTTHAFGGWREAEENFLTLLH